jgi:hypothetical protein
MSLRPHGGLKTAGSIAQPGIDILLPFESAMIGTIERAEKRALIHVKSPKCQALAIPVRTSAEQRDAEPRCRKLKPSEAIARRRSP